MAGDQQIYQPLMQAQLSGSSAPLAGCSIGFGVFHYMYNVADGIFRLYGECLIYPVWKHLRRMGQGTMKQTFTQMDDIIAMITEAITQMLIGTDHGVAQWPLPQYMVRDGYNPIDLVYNLQQLCGVILTGATGGPLTLGMKGSLLLHFWTVGSAYCYMRALVRAGMTREFVGLMPYWAPLFHSTGKTKYVKLNNSFLTWWSQAPAAEQILMCECLIIKTNRESPYCHGLDDLVEKVSNIFTKIISAA